MTGVDAATALVATVKPALAAPAGTVTLAGTEAAPLLLESATCAPPAGAGPFSVTVPLAVVPPATLEGLMLRDEINAGTTASGAVLVAPPYEPEMVTAAGVETALVLTLKLALVAPAATVTLAGTVAAAVLLLESATTRPPEGAAADSVTVPVDDVPPVTLVGLSDNDDSVGPALPGVTVRPADWPMPVLSARP